MSVDLDVDLFIAEIQKRPALYDKSLQEYAEKNIKDKLWAEVCEVMLENWKTMTPQEKREKSRELLSKWKNIRTCFKREYNIQATMAPGSKAKKRRKYIHYDQLSFLLPTVDSKEENSNIIFRNSKSIDWKQCNSVETEKTTARPSTSYGPKRPSQPYEEVSVEKPSRKPSKSYEETLLQMLQEKRNEENEIDEDRYFLLSLLPSFRKLNEEQKFMAKTEILNVIRRARLFDPYVESSNTAASPSASLSVHCTSETILKQEENSCSSDDSSILCSK